MAFRDLDEFLVVEPLVLPIRGKEYTFPGSVSARVWLQLQSISEQLQMAQKAAQDGTEYEPDREVVSEADESEIRREMMGGVEDEMIADGLTSAHVKAVFYTLIAFHLNGREAAEAVWNAQGGPAAPNREARRSQRQKPSRPASSPASSSGPQSPAATSRPGVTSSGTGT